MGRLDGRVAVVTGAASGIGLATAKRLAAEGATVVMVSATKAAIRSLARTLTTDFKDRGNRVNAVSPGNLETPIAEHAGMSTQETGDDFAKTAGETSLGHNGQAEDIAAAVLYLACDDRAVVTASEIVAVGGLRPGLTSPLIERINSKGEP